MTEKPPLKSIREMQMAEPPTPLLKRLRAAIEAEVKAREERIRSRFPGAQGELLVECEREAFAMFEERAVFGRALTPEERAEYRGGGSS